MSAGPTALARQRWRRSLRHGFASTSRVSVKPPFWWRLAKDKCAILGTLLCSIVPAEHSSIIQTSSKLGGDDDAAFHSHNACSHRDDHGTGARRPMLLLAHLDVVEAKPEDWSVDPFKLIEKDGYFYGRGTGDDKFMAAAFVANLVRYKLDGYMPDRDIILALDTDEEIFDRDGLGIQWLLKNKRGLIDAEFALNEGASVALKRGKPFGVSIQTSEKVPLAYRLEVKNRGGHSS